LIGDTFFSYTSGNSFGHELLRLHFDLIVSPEQPLIGCNCAFLLLLEFFNLSIQVARMTGNASLTVTV